jgi:hypothetical protein
MTSVQNRLQQLNGNRLSDSVHAFSPVTLNVGLSQKHANDAGDTFEQAWHGATI